MEVDGPGDIREFDGKRYIPQSRTFIPAALGDNPFLINTGYQATLDAMPEPMRSAIRDGNFMAAREDDPWQVIPTSWILTAQQRWRDRRSEEHTSELQSLMRISYAVFCLKKKNNNQHDIQHD